MSDAKNLPRHVGIILDGNRRWARARNLPTLEGHRRGYENLKKIAYVARDRGVEFLSAFVFSTENWSRSEEEVGYLMNLVLQIFTKDARKMVADGFRVIVLGRPNGVRQKILDEIREVEQMSAKNTGTTLAICFNYGGQWEIADAAAGILRDATTEFLAGNLPENRAGNDENFAENRENLSGKKSEKSPENCAENSSQKTFSAGEIRDFMTEFSRKITPEIVAQNLYHPELPPCDIIVRTSGEERLSGFQLWRAAYAEFIFVAKFWPDFGAQDFDEMLAEFARRSRRFGK